MPRESDMRPLQRWLKDGNVRRASTADPVGLSKADAPRAGIQDHLLNATLVTCKPTVDI